MAEVPDKNVTYLGVIIAGGQSRRFNPPPQNPSTKQDERRDKFLAPFGSKTLLAYIIDRAKKQCPDLILNVNGPQKQYLSYDLDMIEDDYSGVGPLGGMLAAMNHAQKGGYSHIVTFSCDCPFFPENYVTRLINELQAGTGNIAVSQSSGDIEERIHPVMGLFSVALRDDLEAYIKRGERRIMGWIRQHSHKKVVWNNKNPDPFLNINRPEDLAEAEKYL